MSTREEREAIRAKAAADRAGDEQQQEQQARQMAQNNHQSGAWGTRLPERPGPSDPNDLLREIFYR